MSHAPLTPEQVTKLQTALMEHGFDVGPDGADGKDGPNTARAIINARIAFKLDHQDQALYDVALEEVLGILAIQNPVIVGAAAAKGIDILSLLKLIGLAQQLLKGTKMDSTKPWYTSQTIWASGLAVLGTILSFFHVDFGAADQATVVQTIISVVTGLSAVWAIVSRITATKKIG